MRRAARRPDQGARGDRIYGEDEQPEQSEHRTQRGSQGDAGLKHAARCAGADGHQRDERLGHEGERQHTQQHP